MRLSRSSAQSPAHRTPSAPARAFQKARQAGELDAWTTAAGTLPSSSMLTMLRKRVVPLEAKRIPARVVWVNFDLARELGFNVPRSNRLTETLEKQLLDAVAYRAVEPGEQPDGDPAMRLFADLYGGSGIGYNKGAGRAALLPFANLYAKGFPTGLSADNPDDFQHSHGGVSMEEVCYEALWGEVYNELTSRGSSRMLLALDTGEHTVWPDGTRERRAIGIRVDGDCRPGHMMGARDRGGRYSAEVFQRATEATGDLQWRLGPDGEPVPDFDATFARLIGIHARVCAEQYRYRILHGAISTSNIMLSGAQIDLATSTTQPRTAPIKVLAHSEAFGVEHLDRAEELRWAYQAMVHAMPQAEQVRLHATPLDAEDSEIAAAEAVEEAFDHHLNVELVRAMGLKKGLAEQLSAEVPELVTRFGRTVLQLAELHNEGDINADQAVVDQVAAAHVFKFLRRFPAPFFADPKGDHGVLAWELLSLLPEEKWQAKPKVAKAVNKLVESYRELIDAADQRLSPHYTDRAHLERSVCARAEYENAPMPTLYRSDLKRRIQEAIGQFEQSQDPRVIRELIDGSISQTHRNVDALLLQGQMRRLPNDGVELERRTIDGVTYCVRARGDDRWLRVSLVARGSEPEGYRLRGIPGAPVLYGADLEALRYHFTTDCWKVTQEVQGELAVNSRGQVRAVHFDVPLDAGQVSGALEGLFLQKRDEDLWIRDLDRNFRGYHFAVPDPQELAELLVRHDAC